MAQTYKNSIYSSVKVEIKIPVRDIFVVETPIAT